MSSTPPNSIPCILCGGLFLFPGPRYTAHLQNEHGVMYDLDFLVKVSQHKKYFSKIPSIPRPKQYLDSSSQTPYVNGKLCRCCTKSNDSGTVHNKVIVGAIRTHQEKDFKYEESETVVVKPEIVTNSGRNNFSCIKGTKFNEPLASDMHCYFNCGAVFKKGYDLQLHIKLRHKDEDSIEIARAEEAAKFEIALTKRSACLYKCALCDKTVEGWSCFWEHLRKHQISVADYKAKYGSCEIKTVKFQCRICEKVMKHESSTIHKHMQMIHGINWNQYLGRIRMEMKGVHQEPLPDLVKRHHCQICGGTFKYIKEHFKKIHGISVEQYDQLIGEAGGVEFKVLDFNQNQVQAKVSDSDSASLSSVSETSTKFSSSCLPKPSKTEMGNKTVKHCSGCQIQFQDRRQFIEHCQRVHNIRFKTKASQGISKGALSIQQVKKYDSKNVLQSGHVLTENLMMQPQAGKVSKIVWPQKRDTIICNKCGEKFPSWKHLDQHMKFVCKKIKCELCGKTYSNLFNLTKHRRTNCPSKLRTPSSTRIARDIVEHIVETVIRVSPGPKVVLDCTVFGCGQQFGRKVHLRRHLVNYHNYDQ